jgi:hypothetical protein
MRAARQGDARVKVFASPEAMRSGGEMHPLDYPHLYQIQAGDWRISYAVEHNRLAILVLEVLGPDGTALKDPASEKLARKMKIKLLDWPEGSPSRDLPPDELGKKIKIKLLDLADEMAQSEAGRPRQRVRIRLFGTGAGKPRSGKITLLEGRPADADESAMDDSGEEEEAIPARKITPLDSPSV